MKRFSRERLRNARKTKGYSLETLAMLVSAGNGRTITKAAISNWERGVNAPRLEALVSLSEIFNVPIDYFFVNTTNSLFEAARATGTTNIAGQTCLEKESR